MSAFNLSMMSSLQARPAEVSFYFWNCCLTKESPVFKWRPEARFKEVDEKEEATADKHSEESTTAAGEAAEDVNDDESDGDRDFVQHMLQVNTCVLGPAASGTHLVQVSTKCYKSVPVTCPILCLDAGVQRTLQLNHEFLHDSQNEVTFRLEQGDGPLWLTGLHHVHLHDDGQHEDEEDEDDAYQELGDAIEGEEEEEELPAADEGEEDAEEDGEDDEIDENSRFRLADDQEVGDNEDEENVEDEEEEEEEEEEDDDEDEAEMEDKEDVKPKKTTKPKPRKAAAASKKKQLLTVSKKRSPLTTAQLRNRKRRQTDDKSDNSPLHKRHQATRKT